MFTHLSRILVAFLLVFSLIFVLSSIQACTDDDDDSSSNPEVTGCSTVYWNGITWYISGCEYGASSFRVEITQNGNYACFEITCSGGCIATARLCD
ncbi:hypothetical protein ACFL27_22095 [candidate division CSSED10-310 bacterium]|uniref:Secreted protein n=1 Tax=candidate division CSSED10-310 bacterium TaxID=2855610 RepID=A0ABV6Z379_UNCC1